MWVGVERLGRAVRDRLSCSFQLGWSRSAVLLACATLSAFSERNGQPMLMVSGVIGGVDTRAGVHVAAVVDTNGGVAFGHESFPGKGTSNVGCTVVAFWNEVFTGLGGFLCPPRRVATARMLPVRRRRQPRKGRTVRCRPISAPDCTSRVSLPDDRVVGLQRSGRSRSTGAIDTHG